MMPEMKVYLASGATDMRKSYDGLARLIKDEIGKDVFKGELFVFMSRRQFKCEVQHWHLRDAVHGIGSARGEAEGSVKEESRVREGISLMLLDARLSLSLP